MDKHIYFLTFISTRRNYRDYTKNENNKNISSRVKIYEAFENASSCMI